MNYHSVIFRIKGDDNSSRNQTTARYLKLLSYLNRIELRENSTESIQNQ